MRGVGVIGRSVGGLHSSTPKLLSGGPSESTAPPGHSAWSPSMALSRRVHDHEVKLSPAELAEPLVSLALPVHLVAV